MIDALRSKLLTYCPFVFIYYKFKRDSGGGGGRNTTCFQGVANKILVILALKYMGFYG